MITTETIEYRGFTIEHQTGTNVLGDSVNCWTGPMLPWRFLADVTTEAEARALIDALLAERDAINAALAAREPVTVVRVIDHGDDRTTTYYSDGRSYDSEMGWTR